ncbi:phage head morphogenesis protein [Acidisoma sp. 7E03]
MAPRTIIQAAKLQPHDAIAFFRQKANVTSEHWADLMDEAHARGFTVAGAASEALVEDIRREVDRAIAEGTTLQEFQKSFEEIVKKHGWVHNGTPAWRARIIYGTNLSMAYSAGRYAQQTQPFTKRAFPFWRYVHTNCPNPRPQHVAWNGLVLSCDDPWWNTHYPPNGWRCHCYVEVISRPQLAEMGKDGPDQAPPLDLHDWTNKKTGQVFKVPRGIDPGFAYNPGKVWMDSAGRPPLRAGESGGTSPMAPRSPGAKPEPTPEKPNSSPEASTFPSAETPASVTSPVPVEQAPATGRRKPPRIPPRAIPSVPVAPSHNLPATPEEVEQFIQAPSGAIVVGYVPLGVQQAARMSAPIVQLSADTVARQAQTHPEITSAEYRLLPQLIEQPSLVLDQGKGRLFLIQRAGVTYSALVRQHGAVATIGNFHRVRPSSLQRLLMHFTILWGTVRALHQDDQNS